MKYYHILPAIALIDITGGCSGLKNHDHEKPNIIIIMTDEMGYSDLRCYGGEI